MQDDFMNAFDPSKIRNKPIVRPPLLMVYSPNGYGKSTFLSTIPKLFILDTEDKCNEIDAHSYVPIDFDDVILVLNWILNHEIGKLPYEVLAIDTLDWLEKRIHDNIMKKYKVSTIIDDTSKDLNFGKGNMVAANMFMAEIYPLIDAIIRKHNIPVVLCAQQQKVRVKEPDKEEYNVIDLRLESKLAGVISDKVEAKLYLNCRFMRDQKGSMIPTDERYFITTPQKGIAAKNSLDLPHEITISRYNGWNDLLRAIGTNKPPRI